MIQKGKGKLKRDKWDGKARFVYNIAILNENKKFLISVIFMHCLPFIGANGPKPPLRISRIVTEIFVVLRCNLT